MDHCVVETHSSSEIALREPCILTETPKQLAKPTIRESVLWPCCHFGGTLDWRGFAAILATESPGVRDAEHNQAARDQRGDIPA